MLNSPLFGEGFIQMKKQIAVSIEIFFIIIGCLSLMIILHETFNLIDLDGKPTGICFGKCYVGSEYGQFAPAGITWTETPEEYIKHPKANEIQAWIFGILISVILFILMIILDKK